MCSLPSPRPGAPAWLSWLAHAGLLEQYYEGAFSAFLDFTAGTRVSRSCQPGCAAACAGHAGLLLPVR